MFPRLLRHCKLNLSTLCVHRANPPINFGLAYKFGMILHPVTLAITFDVPARV